MTRELQGCAQSPSPQLRAAFPLGSTGNQRLGDKSPFPVALLGGKGPYELWDCGC